MKDHLDIDRIAFIGRTYAEYMDIFGLDKAMFRHARILDCAAGPSSFTAEAHNMGIDATACDTLYDLSAERLLEKGRQDISHVFEKFYEVSHLYSWKYYGDKDVVINLRNKALKLFAEDFVIGNKEGRYRFAELPKLPFPDNSFSLVLSSHFLFLYGDRLDLNFHKASLKELMRVSSGEVRIFPLTGLDAMPYPYLSEILLFLELHKISAEILEVPFEFQRGATKMLRLKRGKAEKTGLNDLEDFA